MKTLGGKMKLRSVIIFIISIVGLIVVLMSFDIRISNVEKNNCIGIIRNKEDATSKRWGSLVEMKSYYKCEKFDPKEQEYIIYFSGDDFDEINGYYLDVIYYNHGFFPMGERVRRSTLDMVGCKQLPKTIAENQIREWNGNLPKHIK